MNFVKVLILASVATAASATQITLTALPSISQTYDGNAGNATRNGFWTATIDLLTGQKLICDDFTHTTPTPTSGPYTYLTSNLNMADPLHNARFKNQADYLTRYRAAALLINELIGLVAPSNQTVTNYQYAIWDLFSPTAVPTTTAQNTLRDAKYNQALNTAPATLQSIYSRLIVYTPDPSLYPTTAGLNPQEFMGWNPVPEPSQAVGLLAALGIGWFLRRRRMA